MSRAASAIRAEPVHDGRPVFDTSLAMRRGTFDAMTGNWCDFANSISGR